MTIKERDEILKIYNQKKEEASRLEKEISELRGIIVEQIGSGKFGDFVVLVSDSQRESFSLGEAKNSLSMSVLEKISAFIKTSTFKMVKVVKI